MKAAVLLSIALFSATAMAEKDPGQCQALRDQVKSIETQQKQPLSGQAQDSLKNAKKDVQARMRELDCKSF